MTAYLVTGLGMSVNGPQTIEAGPYETEAEADTELRRLRETGQIHRTNSTVYSYDEQETA